MCCRLRRCRAPLGRSWDGSYQPKEGHPRHQRKSNNERTPLDTFPSCHLLYFSSLLFSSTRATCRYPFRGTSFGRNVISSILLIVCQITCYNHSLPRVIPNNYRTAFNRSSYVLNNELLRAPWPFGWKECHHHRSCRVRFPPVVPVSSPAPEIGG